MAQSGYTPILIYASGTAAALPSAANLTSSANGAELALNYADGKLYYKNSSGVVTLLASAAAASGTSPGGSTTQVQYNNAGAFAGSANFVWDNSNVRLGIGTSSPSYLLHAAGTNPRINVSASSTGYAGYRASNTSGTFQVAIDDSTGSNYLGTAYGRVIYSDGSYPLQFATNATERMRIDSSGNVGIGASSISNKLEVNGSARFYTAAQGDISITHSGLISSITAAGSVGLALGTNNAERMRITSAGNVGIGTTSPSTKLDIVGPSTGSALADAVRISTSIGFGASYGDGLSFYNSNPSYLAQLAGIYPYTSGFSQTAGNLIFATNNGTTYAERMRIDYSGNVGIGVTPSYRFDVSGASASGIARFANAWGDGTNPAILVDGTGSDGRLVQIKSGGTRSWPLLWVTASTTDVLVVNGDSTIKTAGTISVGGATPSTSGAGITFPATQSASSDANTLDDYEEGAWTGTLKGSASDPTTPVTATGYYTKVGNLVTYSIYFENVNTTGASGSVSVTGLPFTVGQTAASGCGAYNFDFGTGTSLFSYAFAGSTTLYPTVAQTNAAWASLQHSAGTTRYLQIAGSYRV